MMKKKCILLFLTARILESSGFVAPSFKLKKTQEFQALNLFHHQKKEHASFPKPYNPGNQEKKYDRFLAMSSLPFYMATFQPIANAAVAVKDVQQGNILADVVVPVIGGCLAVSFIIAFALEFETMAHEEDTKSEKIPQLTVGENNETDKGPSSSPQAQVKPIGNNISFQTQQPLKTETSDKSVGNDSFSPVNTVGKEIKPMDEIASHIDSVSETLESISEKEPFLSSAKPIKAISKSVASKRMPFDSSVSKALFSTRYSKSPVGKERESLKLNANQSVFSSYLEVVDRAPTFSTPMSIERNSKMISNDESLEGYESNQVTEKVSENVSTRMPFDSSESKGAINAKNYMSSAGKGREPLKLNANQSVFSSYLDIVNRVPMLSEPMPVERHSIKTSNDEQAVEKIMPRKLLSKRKGFAKVMPEEASTKAKNKSKTKSTQEREPEKLTTSKSVIKSDVESQKTETFEKKETDDLLLPVGENIVSIKRLPKRKGFAKGKAGKPANKALASSFTTANNEDKLKHAAEKKEKNHVERKDSKSIQDKKN